MTNTATTLFKYWFSTKFGSLLHFTHLSQLISSEEFSHLFLLLCRWGLHKLLMLGDHHQQSSSKGREAGRRIMGSVMIIWCSESHSIHVARHRPLTKLKFIINICSSFGKLIEKLQSKILLYSNISKMMQWEWTSLTCFWSWD